MKNDNIENMRYEIHTCDTDNFAWVFFVNIHFYNFDQQYFQQIILIKNSILGNDL